MNPPRTVEARIEDPAVVGMRLDVFVSETLGLFSRSQARSRILSIAVNGSPARLGRRLKLGDRISLTCADPPALQSVAEDLPLSVIFENDDVIVVDKPQGMVVHPGNGNHTGTLLNALLFRCRGLAEGFPADDPRPGIVHRLDKETSGVIIAAKNARAHEFLSSQFQDRSVQKRYIAVVAGTLAAGTGRIETRLARDPRNRKRFSAVAAGGRSSLTLYRVLRSYAAGGSPYALVLLAPRTGRTHQLRVHMRHAGAPIVGDPLYGRPDPLVPDATLMLHARHLRIRLPGEDQPRTFSSPLPERFQAVIRRLQSFSPRKGL
jgi:23S rRNA pseudouridine1911/1915/1917 synthase